MGLFLLPSAIQPKKNGRAGALTPDPTSPGADEPSLLLFPNRANVVHAGGDIALELIYPGAFGRPGTSGWTIPVRFVDLG